MSEAERDGAPTRDWGLSAAPPGGALGGRGGGAPPQGLGPVRGPPGGGEPAGAHGRLAGRSSGDRIDRDRRRQPVNRKRYGKLRRHAVADDLVGFLGKKYVPG